MSNQIFLDASLGSSSMLHASLSDIIPVKRRVIKKISGIKFAFETTTFEKEEKTSKSYEESVESDLIEVLNTIDIPPRFDFEFVLMRLKEKQMNYYNKDELYQELEQKVNENGTLSSYLSMLSYLITKNNDNLKIEYLENSKIYSNSNIPFSVLSDISRSQSIYGLFLKHLYNIFQRYNRIIGTNITKNNHIKEQKYYSNLKGDIEKSFEIADPMFITGKTINILYFLYNADNYDEIGDVNYVTSHCIPKEEFDRVYNGFRRNMRSTRYYVLNSDFNQGERSLDMPYPDYNLNYDSILSKLYLNVDKVI